MVSDTVAAPIEQQVNGVENMMYMSSQCTNDGTYTLTITFKPGVDLNIAQVLVQNRVALAQPILPDLVQRHGVAVKKKSSSVLMIVNLFSPDGTRETDLYLSNYATIQVKDELARPRRRRHLLSRPARLQHARLARSAEDGLPRPHRRRRHQGDPAAKHPGRGRADRAAPRAGGRSVSSPSPRSAV